MEDSLEFNKLITEFHIEPEVIKYCYQCSKCSDNCPVTAVTSDQYTDTGYNPRGNILMTLLGRKDSLLEGDDLKIWGCTVCVTCDEVCPQKIELTEVFTFLKNQSIALGKVQILSMAKQKLFTKMVKLYRHNLQLREEEKN